MSNGSAYNSSPSTPHSEARAIQEAIASEERKRAEALEREAADRGETKWYLSFREPQVSESPLRVVSAGYSALDAGTMKTSLEEDEEDEAGFRKPIVTGRRSFGKFNRKIEVCHTPSLAYFQTLGSGVSPI
jgi:hypothetical protein